MLPPRSHEFAHPALAHLERTLFVDDVAASRRRSSGAVRFFEGAGTRATLELVGQEVLSLIRGGTAPEQIAIVCPALERWRAPLETGLGALGVPFAVAAWPRLAADAVRPRAARHCSASSGSAAAAASSTASCARRTPACRARRRTSSRAGCADARSTRTTASRPRRSRCTAIRSRSSRSCARRRRRSTACARPPRAMLRARIRHASIRRRARTRAATCARTRRVDAAARRARRLGRARRHAAPREEIVGALERTTVARRGRRERGRVAVLDLLRARTRSFEVVFVLGLEEGTFPRRTQASPFLDDDARRALGAARLVKPGSGRARPLPLLHRVHARDAAPLPRARGGERRGRRRASRARSGTRSRGSSRRRTCATRRRGARSRR